MTAPNGRDPILDLAALDALGALDPEDRARLDAALGRGDPELEEARRAAQRVAELLLLVPAPLVPSAHLRERVLASVRRRGSRAAARPTRAPGRLRRSVPWLLAAASLVLALLAGLQGLRLRESLVAEHEALADERQALAFEREAVAAERAARLEAERQLAGLRIGCQDCDRERLQLVALLDTLAAPDARVTTLVGRGTAEGARATTWIDPRDGHLVLLARQLPPAPPDRSYQLWVIESGTPRSAGVFDADAAGAARHQLALDAVPAADAALAVTLEPRGGVPAPTGPIVLAQR
jgi:anti-sigma-K factor RskA